MFKIRTLNLTLSIQLKMTYKTNCKCTFYLHITLICREKIFQIVQSQEQCNITL